jgi:alpha-amylase
VVTDVLGDEAVAAVRPHRSATLCELDWRGGETNFLAVLTRRREGYHAKLGAAKGGAAGEGGGGPKSIHDITAVKEEGLADKLIVDPHARASFYDHFFDAEIAVDDVRRGRVVELGDFVGAAYDIAAIDDGPEWARVRCVRRGVVRGRDVEIEKRFSLAHHRPTLEVNITLTNLSDEELPVVYATDIAFTLLAAPADASSRFAEVAGARRSLAETFGVAGVSSAVAFDADRNVGLRARFGAPLDLWQFALETVSQSESGLERTYQGTVWMPVWRGVLAPRREQRVVVALDLGNRETIGVGAAS